MRRNVTLLISTLLLVTPLAAQAGIDKAGTTAANFLAVGAGADVLGMGGATLGFGSDLSAAAWNAAALGGLGSTEYVFSHSSLAGQSPQEWVSGGGRFGFSPTRWAFTGLYQGDGSFDGRDAFNNPTGSFNASSMALGFQLAQAIGPLGSIGVGAKYVSEKLGDVSGGGVTFDLGMRIQAGAFGFGAAAQNAFGKMSYSGLLYDFPTNYGLGVAYSLPLSGLTFALDANFPTAYYSDVRGGVEWRWHDRFALRTGYRQEMNAAAGEPLGGPTFGMGAGANGFWFDYGYITGGDAGNGQHRFGLTYHPGFMNGGSDPSASRVSRETSGQSVEKTSARPAKTSSAATAKTGSAGLSAKGATVATSTAASKPASASSKAAAPTSSAPAAAASSSAAPAKSATAASVVAAKPSTPTSIVAPDRNAPVAKVTPPASSSNAIQAPAPTNVSSAASKAAAPSVAPVTAPAAGASSASSAAAAQATTAPKSSATAPAAHSFSDAQTMGEVPMVTSAPAKTEAAKTEAPAAAKSETPATPASDANKSEQVAALEPAPSAPAAAKSDAPASVATPPTATAPAPPPTTTAPVATAPAPVATPAAAPAKPASAPAMAPKPAEKAPDKAEPSAAAASSPRPKQIKVRGGESLADIAKRWGTTPAAIMMANDLVSEKVKSGTTLKLPPASK